MALPTHAIASLVLRALRIATAQLYPPVMKLSPKPRKHCRTNRLRREISWQHAWLPLRIKPHSNAGLATKMRKDL
jgi:hypothetical protein